MRSHASMLEGPDAHVFETLRARALRPLVLVTDAGDDPRSPTPSWVAAGTAMRTPQGRYAVLTARHNVERADHAICIGVPDLVESYRAYSDPVAGVLHHDDRDVALVALKASHADALSLADRALDTDDLPVEATTDGIHLVTGLPAALRHATDSPDVGFGVIAYVTHRVELVGDRLRVRWDHAVVSKDDAARWDFEAESRQRLPNPEGVSGGAIWRIDAGPGPLWTPSCQLVGVPVSYLEPEKSLFAEPIWAIRDWIEAGLRSIDEDLE